MRPKLIHEAEVFVVADVASPGKKVRWASTIRGSYVMSPSTIQDNCGGILKMKPAIATKRTIFVSENCRKEHNNLLKFIDLRMHSGAQWEIRKVAEGCLLIAKELWPTAVEAYRSNKCPK